MKIGVVTTWFERGASYVSRQYVSTLQKRHDVFIYARGGEKLAKDEEEWKHYAITWGDKSWGKTRDKEKKRKNLEHFRNWIKSNDLDIVFFNEEHVWPAIALCSSMGVKAGAYVDYYTKETVPLFGAYDFLICNTRRHYGVFAWHPQAYFIPWGTDIKLFSPKTYDLVEPGVLRFFHSAGMNPKRKGTDKLIRAFEKLSGGYENIRLIIHTQVPLNKFFPELEGTAEKLKTQEKLVIHEETVKAPGLYHLGDVYVYPTTLEGVGLTIPEALAYGLPVVTSDNEPMNEFVDQNNGRLVKIKKCYQRYFDHYYWPACDVDEEHLLQSMEFYVKNIGQIKTLKENARKSAEQRMDWSSNGKAVLSAFEDSSIIKKKTAVLKKIARLEWIENHLFVYILYRIKVLKLDFFLVLKDLMKKKLRHSV